MKRNNSKKIYPVILAGGQGTRLWPASLPDVPKQFISFGNKSLMLQAIERAKEALKVCVGENASKEIIIVTGESYLPLFPKLLAPELAQASIDASDITLIAEPCAKNTAPAIALALRYVLDKNPSATMLVITADHLISPNKVFAKNVQAAIQLTTQNDSNHTNSTRHTTPNAKSSPQTDSYIVTFGILPTRPETGYGYIHTGEEITRKGKVIGKKALAFKEKPELKTAKKYLTKQTFLWNSGMFCFNAELMANEFRVHCAELYTKVLEAGQATRSNLVKSTGTNADFTSKSKNPSLGKRKSTLWKISKTKQFTVYKPDGIDFASVQKQSIDYALMEHSKQVAVVQASFDWNDIGSWDEASSILSDADSSRNFVINSPNASIYADIPVGIIGLEDITVIIKNNRALVLKKGEGQAVSEIAKQDTKD